MASARKLYIGPQVRRIRRGRGETQAAFAAALGVSPSYVNLIERNQRPASADFLLRMSELEGVDLGVMRGEAQDETMARLFAALKDPILNDAGVTREDMVELSAGLPAAAEAFAALYDAWRASQTELIEARAAGRSAIDDPVEEARSFLQARRNHFPAIEEATEAIAKDMGKAPSSLYDRVALRLDARFGIRTRVMPQSVMTGAVRQLNRHARQLAVSEQLDSASRAFPTSPPLAEVSSASAPLTCAAARLLPLANA